MSSSFDSTERWFRERFEPKSGNEYEKHLFSMILAYMHSANHDVSDAISRDSRVMRAVAKFDTFTKEEK